MRVGDIIFLAITVALISIAVALGIKMFEKLVT